MAKSFPYNSILRAEFSPNNLFTKSKFRIAITKKKASMQIMSKPILRCYLSYISLKQRSNRMKFILI